MTNEPESATHGIDEEELRCTRTGRLFFTLIEMIQVSGKMPAGMPEETSSLILAASALLDIDANEAQALIFGSQFAAESLEDQRKQLARLLRQYHEAQQLARRIRDSHRVLMRGFEEWQREHEAKPAPAPSQE